MSHSPAKGPFFYELFGLTVQSDIEMPQLLPSTGPGADVTISRTPIHHPQRHQGGAVVAFTAQTQYLAWETVGAFCIPSPDRIEVDPNTGVSDNLVALPLLGSVIAALLHRRGLLVLHASAVSINGHGVALLGDKGAGKSTTAGALVAAGHSLLTDDVVALAFGEDGAAQILSAYGQLKLWDEAVEGLGPLDLEAQGRLHPEITKSQYGVTAGFSAAGAALSRLYVLQRGEAAAVSMMEPRAGLEALLRFSYMARFGEAGFGAQIGQYFARCAALASAGQVRLLQVPQGLQRIGQAITVIEDDLGSANSALEPVVMAPPKYKHGDVQQEPFC